jgi:hypothetical protein
LVIIIDLILPRSDSPHMTVALDMMWLITVVHHRTFIAAGKAVLSAGIVLIIPVLL